MVFPNHWEGRVYPTARFLILRYDPSSIKREDALEFRFGSLDTALGTSVSVLVGVHRSNTTVLALKSRVMPSVWYRILLKISLPCTPWINMVTSKFFHSADRLRP